MGQQIDHYPPQKSNVSDDKFKMANRILEETYSQVKKNKGEFNYANYWNLSVAYSLLKQEKKEVRDLLNLSKAKDPFNFSLLFSNNKNKRINWGDYFTDDEFALILSESERIVKTCRSSNSTKNDEVSNSELYDQQLVQLMREIDVDDQKYRSGNHIDLEKQQFLDKQNQRLIDSLYAQYGKYIGKSLVGEHNSYVMWSVIQHSYIEYMERYLPAVYEATKKNDLDTNLLKMLLDRIYTERENYQIFGSQMGVTIAPNNVVEEVKVKYGFLKQKKPQNEGIINTKKRMNNFLSRLKT